MDWANYEPISIYIGECYIEIRHLGNLRFLMYELLCMKVGCGLFDIKNYEASNSHAKLLDQSNFIDLSFCSEGCHGNELRIESRLAQLLLTA